jgi:NhaA family Na+:H+ antiporter
LSALLEPVTLGIGAGLVLGKVVGVFGSAWLLIKSGAAAAPAGASTMQLFGVAALCGIGFTMSLFIGGLAFEGLDPVFETRVKLGVLAGSAVAALAGSAILLLSARLSARATSTGLCRRWPWPRAGR